MSLFNFKKILLAGALSFASITSFANTKVGVVDMADILNSEPQTESANKRLQAEFGARKDQLDNDQKTLQADVERLQKDGDTMTADQSKTLQESIRVRQRDSKRRYDDLAEDYRKRDADEQATLRTSVRKALEAVATEMGLDVILSGNGDVLFASKRVQVTEQVKAKLAQLAK